jgi:hypothetical protein
MEGKNQMLGGGTAVPGSKQQDPSLRPRAGSNMWIHTWMCGNVLCGMKCIVISNDFYVGRYYYYHFIYVYTSYVYDF